MPEYLSPGVYVEEVPSSVKPIAGVSTSTAGFIGIVPDSLPVPPTLAKTKTIDKGQVDGTLTTYALDDYPVVTVANSYQVLVNGQKSDATLQNTAEGKAQIVFTAAPARASIITVSYTSGPLVGEEIGTWDGTNKKFPLRNFPVVTDANAYKVRIGANAASAAAVNNAKIENTVDDKGATTGATATITGDVPTAVKAGDKVFADYMTFQTFKPAAKVGQAVLCTNFTEYKNAFGDFSLDPNHRQLTQAVYGFFNNGGTRCYVTRITAEADLDKALAAFELVDEIAIVAAPGMTGDNVRSKVVAHCKSMGDRFAVLDGPATIDGLTKLTKTSADSGVMPARSDYAAWYFPWIKVYDPVAQKFEANNPKGIVSVAPSGHIAGIYARVDNNRGVHKAPANEPVVGALDVTQRLSKAQQDGLNPKGVNCIRVLNDNILLWGARTVGGDDNTDLKYINVRRTLLFLRESIDEGTQWVVFEPNSPALWQKITRNVTAFLMNVWRSGALFGTTAQEAFYVKCDRETNPQSSIDQGMVVTEIGVAIVRPAEFVIFRISQWAAPGS
jgi:phage tail sheath protein FI